MASAFARLTELKELVLNLSENKIRDAGAAAVAESLRNLRQLTKVTVWLMDSALGAPGATAVAEILRELPQLTEVEVNLFHNPLGAEEKKKLRATFDALPVRQKGLSLGALVAFLPMPAMAADGEEQDWVQQVHQTEQTLVDVISLDGDLVVEALSNIPQDARGRLRTMLVLAEEVVVQAAHGYQIVIDTGLGTAGWYTTADEPEPAAPVAVGAAEASQVLGLAPGQAWADTTDVPGTDDSFSRGAYRTSRFSGSHQRKAAASAAYGSPYHCEGQPAAKAPTVPPPPPLGAQRGTPGVGPAALAAFPNDLVSFNAGLFIANYSGDRDVLAAAPSQTPKTVAWRIATMTVQTATAVALPDVTGLDLSTDFLAVVVQAGLHWLVPLAFFSLPGTCVLRLRANRSREHSLLFQSPAQCSQAMSAVSDSEVTFRAKALQHGIPETSLQDLLESMEPQATDQEVANVKRDEHLLLAQALSRRGLAIEMAGMGTFEVHEAYARGLLEHLHRPPPVKFEAPGIDAVLRADRELWIRVAEEVGSDFVGPGKTAAVDEAIRKWQHSMQVAFFLVPVPKPEKTDRLQPPKRTWEQTAPLPYTDKGSKGKHKGKFMSQAWQAGKSGTLLTPADLSPAPAPDTPQEQQASDAPPLPPEPTLQPQTVSPSDQASTGTGRMSKAFARLDPDVLPPCTSRRLVARAAQHAGLMQVILACQENDVIWSLENPESHIFHGTFDSCVYGGARKKATTFWHWASLVTEDLSRTGRLADFSSAQGHSWVKLESAKDRVKFVPGNRLQDPAFPKGSTTIKVMVEHGTWGALVEQPVSPEVFLQRAVLSHHPQTALPPLPAALDRTVALLAGRKLTELHALRCQRLKTMCDMATEFQAREDSDHANMAPHLRGILQGKRIRLFECLLQGLHYPDQSLPQDMRQGFSSLGGYQTRRLGVREADLPFAKVAVYNPETGSVHGFCRCSLALWHIAVSLLMLPLTVFFDDYTAITLEQDCNSLTQSFLLLLKLLGWQAALTGSKATDFAESFDSLGIAYILPRTPSGFVRVRNTDSRKREVATTCLRVLQTGTLSPAEALAFAGRLRWLDAQTFGRIGRWAFRVILEHGTKPGRRSNRQLTPAVKDAINWILDNVPQAEPRAFKVPAAKATQVFTDGSFEQGVGRLGGVLCNASGCISDWFQAIVPADVVQGWSLQGTQHPILQCELLAVCVAAAIWGNKLSDLPVTWWIDNDAARHCLISARGFPDSECPSSFSQATEHQVKALLQTVQVAASRVTVLRQTADYSAEIPTLEKACFGQVKRTRSNLSLPWEDPAFQFVVQDRNFLDSLQDTLLSQPDPVPLPQPVSQSAEAKLQSASLPTPKLRTLGQWKPQDSQAERQAALSKWSQLFRAVPHLFRPETVSEVVHECSRTELGNLDLRFAKKSTNTLLNRVSSLQRFAAWLLRSFPHEPLSEALVFLYCQNVTSQVTGSSVPDQLSQALNFADGCLGLHVAVRWLQTLADSDEPQYECYVAATLLFMVYARARHNRHSDLRRSQSLIVDTDDSGRAVFIECEVLNPKQSKQSRRRNMFLPLVAPAEGICQEPWAERWLELRKSLGLKCHGSLEDDPLLPDLAADGSLLKTNMDAATTTKWMRCLLSRQPGSNTEDLLKMSSQGLKATCLSWTMKAGIPDPDQTLLGYHSRGRSASALSYGRDSLAGPLRAVEFAVRNSLVSVGDFGVGYKREPQAAAAA
ncbi:unnamed protein product [Symbiodinium necroappetens]|uniref:Uncharacterized protein n=1 Tax=Symbiodinium necroappetens TaxID=1628268 RepID=A0A813CAU1_9DINO|nr:unnamed protein product [Symbiodinium necroappetens]